MGNFVCFDQLENNQKPFEGSRRSKAQVKLHHIDTIAENCGFQFLPRLMHILIVPCDIFDETKIDFQTPQRAVPKCRFHASQNTFVIIIQNDTELVFVGKYLELDVNAITMNASIV